MKKNIVNGLCLILMSFSYAFSSDYESEVDDELTLGSVATHERASSINDENLQDNEGLHVAQLREFLDQSYDLKKLEKYIRKVEIQPKGEGTFEVNAVTLPEKIDDNQSTLMWMVDLINSASATSATPGTIILQQIVKTSTSSANSKTLTSKTLNCSRSKFLVKQLGVKHKDRLFQRIKSVKDSVRNVLYINEELERKNNDLVRKINILESASLKPLASFRYTSNSASRKQSSDTASVVSMSNLALENVVARRLEYYKDSSVLYNALNQSLSGGADTEDSLLDLLNKIGVPIGYNKVNFARKGMFVEPSRNKRVKNGVYQLKTPTPTAYQINNNDNSLIVEYSHFSEYSVMAKQLFALTPEEDQALFDSSAGMSKIKDFIEYAISEFSDNQNILNILSTTIKNLINTDVSYQGDKIPTIVISGPYVQKNMVDGSSGENGQTDKIPAYNPFLHTMYNVLMIIPQDGTAKSYCIALGGHQYLNSIYPSLSYERKEQILEGDETRLDDSF